MGNEKDGLYSKFSTFCHGKANLPQIFFFKTKTLQDPTVLSRLFVGYSQYLHETLWLLQQKFLEKLLVASTYHISLSSIAQLRAIQKRAFETGKQVDMGEIAIQTYLLSANQFYPILQQLGMGILVCNSCKQHFKVPVFLRHISYNCPQCGVVMEQIIPQERFIMQALRSSYGCPRPLLNTEMAIHEPFMFLSMQDHPDMDLHQLELELNMLLQSLYHWVNSPHTFSDPEIRLFWGYQQNLQELFWLFTQKMFARFCISYQYLTPNQLQEGLAIQKRAFQENRQFHLGEVALQTYILNEEQIHLILTQLGNRLLFCKGCNRYFWQMIGSSGDFCCFQCKSFLTTVFPKCETLVQVLRVNLSQPLLLYDFALIPHNHFTFYRSRSCYIADFSLSTEEIDMAFQTFYEPFKNEDTATPSIKGEDLLYIETRQEQREENSQPDMPSVSGLKTWDIDQLMNSMAKINAETTEEEIYNQDENNSLTSKLLNLEDDPLSASTRGQDSQNKPLSKTRQLLDDSITGTAKMIDSLADISTETSEEEIYESDLSAQGPEGVLALVPKQSEGTEGAMYEQQTESATKATDIADNEKIIVHFDAHTSAKVPTQSIRARSVFPTELHPVVSNQKQRHFLVPVLFIFMALAGVGGMLYKFYQSKHRLLMKEKETKKSDTSPTNTQSDPLTPDKLEPDFQKTSPLIKDKYPLLKHEPKTADGTKQQAKSTTTHPVPSNNKIDETGETNLNNAIDLIDQKLNNTRPSTTSLKSDVLKTFVEKPDTNSRDVIKTIETLASEQKLMPKDISVLKQLYWQYPNNPKLRSSVLDGIASIKGEEAQGALEEILHNPVDKNDRIVVVEAMSKTGKSCKKTLLQLLQSAEDQQICIAAAQSLGKSDPKDEEIYQCLVAKFYAITSDNLRQAMLHAMSQMELPEQNAFFVKVILQRGYSEELRIEAIKALMEDSSGNAAMFIPDLTQIANIEKGPLRIKIQEAIQMLEQ